MEIDLYDYFGGAEDIDIIEEIMEYLEETMLFDEFAEVFDNYKIERLNYNDQE